MEQELFTLPEHMSSQPVGFLLCLFSVLWTIVVLSSISFYHCIVCPLIHDFLLCLRFFLQTFLNISPNYETCLRRNVYEKLVWRYGLRWLRDVLTIFKLYLSWQSFLPVEDTRVHGTMQLTATIKLKHCFEK